MHIQLLHRIPDRGLRDVNSILDPHLASQVEPVLVYVADHDMPCADVFSHGRGHDADRARPRDQDILSDQIKRKCGMDGVPERIQNRRLVVRHAVRNRKDITRRNREVFGEAARPVHAHADRIDAKVTMARPTIPAVPANDVSLS